MPREHPGGTGKPLIYRAGLALSSPPSGWTGRRTDAIVAAQKKGGA
jgi:hypothetical protein